MTKYEYGMADALADVDPASSDADYMAGYRSGRRAADEDERGVGPGWDE